MEWTGTQATWFEDFVRHDFTVSDRPVTVVAPRRALPGMPWAWKGEFLDAFPGTELALLRRGFHVVYLGYPDQFGHPRVMAKWDALYDYLTEQQGFARKPALIGMSRGALYCYAWAAAHPERVACIFGDAPVCDIRSWPAGRGRARGNLPEWKRFMEVFGFASEAEALAYRGSPIDILEPLAAARIPILHVYGDADLDVPWDENTGVLAERYRRLGGAITLIGKPGCAHHPHGLEDPAPIAAFIERHTTGVSGPA